MQLDQITNYIPSIRGSPDWGKDYRYATIICREQKTKCEGGLKARLVTELM